MTRPAPIIADATSPTNIAAVRELFQEYQAGLGIDLCFQEFAAELDNLPGEYSPPRGRLLIACIDFAVAGCIALRPIGSDACEMKRLYVRPAFRASGVGEMLVERILAEARAIGYRRICLDTLPTMEAAQRLYERFGFKDISPYRDNPIDGARFLALELA